MSYSHDVNNHKIRYVNSAIASGTTSAAVDIRGGTLVGIFTPASLASTALTFKTATELGGAYVAVKDKTNAAYSITVDSSAAYYAIDPSIAAGLRFVQVEAGSSEMTKTFTLVYRNID